MFESIHFILALVFTLLGKYLFNLIDLSKIVSFYLVSLVLYILCKYKENNTNVIKVNVLIFLKENIV